METISNETEIQYNYKFIIILQNLDKGDNQYSSIWSNAMIRDRNVNLQFVWFKNPLSWKIVSNFMFD